ncbi:MAG: arginine--tRNA ligase [Gammaproteobacteria bacterium]|nr:arginine--tRNA ligase [Gammaproteobacteria bacterium]
MKATIAELLHQSLLTIIETGAAEFTLPAEILVERARDPRHGDLASNVAMALAKKASMPPRELATLIVEHLPQTPQIERVSIAGPGFINFTLAAGVTQQLIAQILGAGEQYGRSDIGEGQKILVEFISANPTGPLHVGHGRLAAYGASVAALLEAVGYDVHREYYVNDAGRQMDILAVSLWLRYLQKRGEEISFPANAYRGEYIVDIAKTLQENYGDRFHFEADAVLANLPQDEPDGGDKEVYIDAIANRARELLGDDYAVVHDTALTAILADIKQDLEEFGVTIDTWFSERSLTDQHLVDRALVKLQEHDSVFEKDGALWFRATNYGDDKDRVVRRANGQKTYFASDIAYHLNKRQRGFDLLLDVLGSDHHGYVTRVRAGLEAMGEPPESLEVRLMQFVALYRGGKKAQMSTRSGGFVSLRELREEVGNDAARFFYVMRSNDQHLDFDLDLAKEKREENPVFYVQYAHARTHRILQHPEVRKRPWDRTNALKHLAKLDHVKEEALLKQLARYPEIIQLAARNRAPQTVVNYLRELCASFHSFYNDVRVLCDDNDLRDARLALATATAQVISNGLGLLGVSAPTRM